MSYVPSKKMKREPLLEICQRVQLKRFSSTFGLTPGAIKSRNQNPEIALVSIAKASNSLCRVCNEKITKGNKRIGLFLECYKGYKGPALTHYLHVKCVENHPEAKKLVWEDVKNVELLSNSEIDVLKEFIGKNDEKRLEQTI